MTRIDVVVAVRDEEHTIPGFLADARQLRLPASVDLRMLFVEDSSTDRTRAVLRQLAEHASDVAYYAVKNEFGQGVATVFGIARASGDAVIMMDVDGTHPLNAIPTLVDRFLRGNDVVQCVRKTLPERKAYRNAGTTAFHFVARWLTGVNTGKQDIYYRLVSADVAKDLLRHRRYCRWLRFPLPTAPGKLSFVEVESVERTVGRSKYNLVRLAKLAVDAVLSLMSGARLLVWSALVLASAYLLWQLGMRWLPLGMALLLAAAVARYFVLERFDVLARMTVIESIDRTTTLAGRVV